jgi:ABC-type polysaccharide/polyol phosphate transport system ATPase subunit
MSMPSENSVRVVDAGKRYVKYDDVPTLIGFAKRLRARNTRGELWAVRHLDFEVAPGETVGIIGRNGAGKTTTLQMLAGVTAPTEGSVSVRGRVSPLIAVGVGFHQELTGRENVYVNGTVLGMRRRDLDRQFDDIVAFAELEKFIDTPVKFYSSGMLVRLGFSVAIAARPDVLLIDEVLAVGDLPFQLKCYERIAEIRAAGTSVVVVSHNLTAVRNLCTRVVVMESGSPRFVGPTAEGISAYHELIEGTQHDDASPSAPVRVLGTELLGASGEPTVRLRTGEEAIVRFEVEFMRPLEDPVFGLTLETDSGVIVYQDSTYVRKTGRFEVGQRVRCAVRFRAALPTGTYSVRGAIKWSAQEEAIRMGHMVLFYVEGRPFVVGTADMNASFELNDAPIAMKQEGSE